MKQIAVIPAGGLWMATRTELIKPIAASHFRQPPTTSCRRGDEQSEDLATRDSVSEIYPPLAASDRGEGILLCSKPSPQTLSAVITLSLSCGVSNKVADKDSREKL